MMANLQIIGKKVYQAISIYGLFTIEGYKIIFRPITKRIPTKIRRKIFDFIWVPINKYLNGINKKDDSFYCPYFYLTLDDFIKRDWRQSKSYLRLPYDVSLVFNLGNLEKESTEDTKIDEIIQWHREMCQGMWRWTLRYKNIYYVVNIAPHNVLTIPATMVELWISYDFVDDATLVRLTFENVRSPESDDYHS